MFSKWSPCRRIHLFGPLLIYVSFVCFKNIRMIFPLEFMFLVLSPHNADYTKDYFELGWEVFAKNLTAFARQQRVRHTSQQKAWLLVAVGLLEFPVSYLVSKKFLFDSLFNFCLASSMVVEGPSSLWRTEVPICVNHIEWVWHNKYMLHRSL